jgi:hypothetical protein
MIAAPALHISSSFAPRRVAGRKTRSGDYLEVEVPPEWLGAGIVVRVCDFGGVVEP